MRSTIEPTHWACCPYPADRTSVQHALRLLSSHAMQVVVLALSAVSASTLLLWFCVRFEGSGLLLSALAGTSALIYLDLLLESPNRARRLINFVAPPAIFAAAYLSLGGAPGMLAAAFLLHAFAVGGQLPSGDTGRDGLLWFWLVFNGTLTVLLL